MARFTWVVLMLPRSAEAADIGAWMAELLGGGFSTKPMSGKSLQILKMSIAFGLAYYQRGIVKTKDY